MTLYRVRYISAYDDKSKKLQDAVAKIAGMRPAYIKEEAFYWRKSNQIRGWFAEKIGTNQHGVCRGEVTRADFEELRDVIGEVLGRDAQGQVRYEWSEEDVTCATRTAEDKARALEMLPPCQGFFFGTYEIDYSYWQDLESTHLELTRMLASDKALESVGVSYDYEYTESW